MKQPFSKRKEIHAIKQAAMLLKTHKCTSPSGICLKKLPHIPAIFYYYIVKAAFLCNPTQFVHQFSWTQIKHCTHIPHSVLDTYLKNPIFVKQINTAISKIQYIQTPISMIMTKYGS